MPLTFSRHLTHSPLTQLRYGIAVIDTLLIGFTDQTLFLC